MRVASGLFGGLAHQSLGGCAGCRRGGSLGFGVRLRLALGFEPGLDFELPFALGVFPCLALGLESRLGFFAHLALGLDHRFDFDARLGLRFFACLSNGFRA